MGNVITDHAICSAISQTKRFTHTVSLEELDKQMQRFWEFENIEMCTTETAEHRAIKELFDQSHYRDESGRHVVKIPIKPHITEIGSSRSSALKRFFMLEKKAMREPEFWQLYKQFMNEYEQLGHMMEVTKDPEPGSMVYYIPHHGLRQGAKFRVVFDGSCVTDNGISLNDAQFIGPKLQRDLHETLMRFRRHKIAVNADITKMYRQVKIDEKHWNLQRIFYRDHPSLPLKEYWLVTITYGLSSSPYLSVMCMNEGAKQLQDEFPEAVNVILNDFYMDVFRLLICSGQELTFFIRRIGYKSS